jgi:hypothetical protein
MTIAMAVAVLAAGSASADLRVLESTDVVYLYDGTEVRGTVIAVGIKAIVIIVDEKERIIPREHVVKVVRGEVKPEVKGYMTEVVLGMKRITGVGESAGEPDDPGEAVAGDGTEPKPPSGPKITKEQLLLMMKGNPVLARIVKAQGGPDKALEWLEKNRSNPEVKKYLDAFLKGGQLPPMMRPQGGTGRPARPGRPETGPRGPEQRRTRER